MRIRISLTAALLLLSPAVGILAYLLVHHAR